jgi:hypothetical protein
MHDELVVQSNFNAEKTDFKFYYLSVLQCFLSRYLSIITWYTKDMIIARTEKDAVMT